jgi:hypothetical protein
MAPTRVALSRAANSPGRSCERFRRVESPLTSSLQNASYVNPFGESNMETSKLISSAVTWIRNENKHVVSSSLSMTLFPSRSNCSWC